VNSLYNRTVGIDFLRSLADRPGDSWKQDILVLHHMIRLDQITAIEVAQFRD
jgi:hypothetical protein